MVKAKVRASLFKGVFSVLALTMFPLLLNATQFTTKLLRNDILKIEVVKLIDTMGKELQEKTAVNAYAIATNEHFPEKFNLVEYSKQYEAKLSKPYVLLIFAPYASITKKSEARGRVAIIPSSEALRELYDYDDVRDALVDIVAVKDSNTKEDKYNIGVLQGYSELVDNIAESKGIELENSIPNDTSIVVNILRVLIYFGTAVLLWMFVFRPLWLRMKNGKRE